MVCERCRAAVQKTFEEVGLHPQTVKLGEVTTHEPEIDDQTRIRLDAKLVEQGFERIDDRKGRLVEAIKNTVVSLVHHSDISDRKLNWSQILSDRLHYDYNYISNLFSSLEGATLEQFIIRQKIEKAKELLFYDEMNLGEIARLLGYSSVAHLSGQFKKVTGQTPSEMKKNRSGDVRKSIDKV